MTSLKADRLYIAATDQHVGKTTTTLGLASVFSQRGINVGYCKPVGQQYLEIDSIRVDKDTLLFADLLRFTIKPEWHSPVILGSGATAAYLEQPQAYPYRQSILTASATLMQNHQFTIYEGTGHPGVGSVVGLSNADVAHMVGAPVVMVVEGGIGSTIDRLNLCLALFHQRAVPVVGVVINKVMPDKLEKIRRYVGQYLEQRGLPVLGVMPYVEALAYPNIRNIKTAVHGSVIANIEQIDRQVEDIMPGSLIEAGRIRDSRNILLVVGADRLNNAIHKIDLLSQINDLAVSPLAGILATGEGQISDSTMTYVKQHGIPLIRTHLDTYGSVSKINRIEVKINPNSAWQIKKVIDMISGNIDFERLMQVLHAQASIM